MEAPKPETGHKVDPYVKREKTWILEQVKQLVMGGCHATNDRAFMPMAAHYNMLKLYSIGKQPTAQFTKAYQLDGAADMTIANLDYRPTKVHLKVIDIAVNKILGNDYDPVATPVDMTAKDKNDKAYIDLKAKLAAQKLLATQAPELAAHPMFKPKESDPQDLEELEMRFNFGEQFGHAVDTELMIQLAMYKNDVPNRIRKPFVRDLIVMGVSGFKDELDANKKPYARLCDPRSMLTSYCQQHDFSDARFWAELITEDIENVADNFTLEEKKILNDYCACNYPSSPMMPFITFNPLPKGKCRVLDIQFKSVDTNNYQVKVDKYGNMRSSKADWNASGDTYIQKDLEQIYKAKWVVGTELLYDFGLKEDTKRKNDKKERCNAEFDYHFFADHMEDMRHSSYLERMLPMIDDFQKCKLKLQDIRHNQITNGFSIDLDALESINLTGADGNNLNKKQILNLFRQTGRLLYRGNAVYSKNANAKPIDVLVNQVSEEVDSVFVQMANAVSEMKDVFGLNQITDGSTPPERTLAPGYETATEATNNALGPLISADKLMLTTLSIAFDYRTKQSVLYNGGYSGYMPGINGTTMDFIKNTPGNEIIDHAIMLTMRSTKEERQYIIAQMQPNMDANIIDIADVLTVLYTNNVKQAGMILAYKIKRSKENMVKVDMMKQQQLAQSNQQTGIAIETAKQSSMRLQNELEIKLQNVKDAAKLEQIQLQLSGQLEIAKAGHVLGVTTAAIGAHAKMATSGQQPMELPEDDGMEPMPGDEQETGVKPMAAPEPAMA